MLRSKKNEPIQIFFVEDDHLIRESIILLLQQQGGFKIVGSASTGEDTFQQLIYPPSPKIDLILLDYLLPDTTALELVPKIRIHNLDFPILVLTSQTNTIDVSMLTKALIDGIILKESRPEELFQAISMVMNRHNYIDPRLSDFILGAAVANSTSPSEKPAMEQYHLTKRELEIINYVACGYTNSEIATCLNISVRTVNTHKTNINSKINRKTRREWMEFATEQGIIEKKNMN